MLGPCAQRQRYVRACCAYRPTFIRCLSINPPPPHPPSQDLGWGERVREHGQASVHKLGLMHVPEQRDAVALHFNIYLFTGSALTLNPKP